ncbi:MAG: M20/M25/M40 family metallo-hydrolase [Breznakibacter sp.]|nr:M20/M25/M40 family metallo-hydrolase [Breznakibacter sp.]
MRKNLWVCAIALIIACQLSAQEYNLQERLKKHVEILASDSLEGRGEGTLGIEKARKYIISEFEQAGVKPYKSNYQHNFSFKIGAVLAHSQNLIGWIEGNDETLKNEFIVIGAHYDHMGYDENNGEKSIFNGADDNASGTASLIELARMLNSNKSSLKRSVLIVAFGAEESGLKGSNQFFTDSILDASKIKCMFSIDMVGMYSKNEGVRLTGINTVKSADIIIAEAQKRAPITISKTSAKIENRTDTEPFGNKGIPAVHVFTGLKSPYHKPQDDSQLLDYAGMAGINEFMYQLTSEIANNSSIEPTKQFATRAKNNSYFSVTPIARLGIGNSYNNYPEQFFEAKSIFAYNVGFATEITLTKHWAIQPEVVFNSSGSKTPDGTMQLQQVATPVHLLWGFDNRNVGNIYFMFGGYYKYILSGKDGGKKIDYSNDYNREQYGVSYGFGVDVMKVQVNFISQYSINGLYKDSSMEDIRETGFYLNLGYRF